MEGGDLLMIAVLAYPTLQITHVCDAFCTQGSSPSPSNKIPHLQALCIPVFRCLFFFCINKMINKIDKVLYV